MYCTCFSEALAKRLTSWLVRSLNVNSLPAETANDVWPSSSARAYAKWHEGASASVQYSQMLEIQTVKTC